MKRLGLAALLLVCGCQTVITPPKAPKPAPAPRDMPQIPRSFAEEQDIQRKVDHLKMRVYDVAEATARGSKVSNMKSWSSEVPLSAPVFLINHPTQGLILFGAGPRPANSPSGLPIFQPRNGGLVGQLATDHVDLTKVRWIVLPNLRPEYVGSLESFPNATILIDQREWNEQRQQNLAGAGGIDTSSLGQHLKVQLVDVTKAPSYGSFDHGLDFFKDGTIFLIDLAGATPGTMGLWASLDEGPILLTGDASWILDNHQDLALPNKSSIENLDHYWRRLYEMKAAQSAVPRLVIYPAHDLEPLKLQPRPDVTRAP